MSARYAKVHAQPSGPGDARPTALQIIADEAVAGKLNGKTVLITGASAGLGVETAKALYETGATLILTARNLQKARKALGPLAEDATRVHPVELDLNSLASVRTGAARILELCGGQLHLLIANAGIMAVPEGRTADGFELQLGTNHLAHFLLINLLTDALLAAAPGRVVILSSIGHRGSEVHFDNLNLDGEYDPWVSYGQAKTANLWTAVEFERRYGARGVHAFAVQPGGVPSSGLMDHLPKEAKTALEANEDLVHQFKSVEQGAATTVLAAVGKELEGKGGLYLEDCQIAGAWDPASGPWAPGYAAWAYDGEKAKKLWDVSAELVKL
ncbi:putative short-chain dehydrogenase protein [Botryosphaeria dothidea]|uniref:Short-chain dehydrogenase protein n=1 Tax=Botryosphaeria dothidea TaxID=55169 RepID=A0A8H4IN69_9PEZI|nr:putative short-chain dehydrogenase protein [Botryosphaeria dothidea]